MATVSPQEDGHPALRHANTIDSMASEEAIPTERGDVAGLLVERLRAWKHAVGYIEAYVSHTEAAHKVMAKEYEKVLKTVSEPLKEGHHFAQDIGGVASFFENVRTNTQGITQSHHETERALKTHVLPILGRLHTEIKDRAKHIHSASEKSSKSVAKARNYTQNHIELLGQHASGFDSMGSGQSTAAGGLAHINIPGTHSHGNGGKLKPDVDPYILRRGVLHRLHKQVIEENNHRQDLLGVQNQMQQFEGHIVQTIQQALGSFYEHVGAQADRQKALYGDIIAAGQRLPLDFEWGGFTTRYADVLIDPSSPARSIESIQFPNQGHQSTKALIEGTLNRKGKVMRSYSAAYYVVTPCNPEISLYLPDCTIGALSKPPNAKFIISGKDAGSTMKALSSKHDYAFKAATHEDAAKWHQIISTCAGLATNESPLQSPISPTTSGPASGAATPPSYSRTGIQELGVTNVGGNGAGPAPARNGVSGVPIVVAGDIKKS
ncbi:unnamed protein product [Tuber melanosporum]|uniref:(Perigord truffle) hypothetical protein n=1 Tax=Tuber melanosporum (strain Mel28) TaxID=656061 RepID=D5GFL6_TUBMM|nr:uncharacterized protein GSTUM_00006974001 [Tuber melanosporum]CAZ83309.1 unnamed protein product [Tuber melanosporum]